MTRAPAVLRRALWPLSLPYALATHVRNAGFAHGWRTVHRLPVAVVSIGNLTVGGTGKTPTVAWLVERARSRGRRPGVLARGYGRAPGAVLNDEGELLAARFPGLPQVQDANRVAGGRRLCAEHDVDLVILDDGFQHRRLHRDVDVVCVDAAEPFGGGMLLPAGDLREAPRGLARAHLIVLTRAGSRTAAERAAVSVQLRRAAGRDLPVLAAEHVPTDIVEFPSGRVRSPTSLAGERVVLVSAIARPAAFAATARGLGVDVVEHVVHRDHHRYTAMDAQQAIAAAARAGARVLTTEKDAVKLRGHGIGFDVLRIGLQFLDREPTDAEVGLA